MTAEALTALWQVMLIDLVLAGDNAVVVGLAAAAVAPHLRLRVVAAGIGVAVIMRVVFAVLAVELLQVKGVLLAGGVLLLWVCWRFLTDLRHPRPVPRSATPRPGQPEAASGFGRAVFQIALADLSMSLDNVLAVAGAAAGHHWVLIAGLAISIALMGLAASLIAGLLQAHRWIAWVGLAVIVYVAVTMIVDGIRQLGWLPAF